MKIFITTTWVIFWITKIKQAASQVGVYESMEEPTSQSVTSLSLTSVLLSSDTLSTILSSTKGTNGEGVGTITSPHLSTHQEQSLPSPDGSSTVSNLSSSVSSVTSLPPTYISTKSDTSSHIIAPRKNTPEGDALNSSDLQGKTTHPPEIQMQKPNTASQPGRCRIPPCSTHGQWTVSDYNSTDRNYSSNMSVDPGFRLTYMGCNEGYFKCQQRELLSNDGKLEPSAKNLCLPLGCRNLTLRRPLLSARYKYNGEVKCFNASHQQNGTVIKYSCKEGYKIRHKDPSQAICIGESWEPQQTPQCVKVWCRISSCLTNGQWTIYNGRSTNKNCSSNMTVDPGTSLTYKCDEGYFKCQEKELVCTDGEWEPSVQNLCLPLGCRNLTLSEHLLRARYTYHGEKKCFSTSHQQNGTVITYSCKQGYKIRDNDTSQATCIGESWDPQQTPHCVKDNDSAQPHPSSSPASVLSSSDTSVQTPSSTENTTREKKEYIIVWLLVATVVTNATLAFAICAIIKQKRAGRSEQTAENGSVNEVRAENNVSSFQMETNLCSLSNNTTERDKNDIMEDNIVYESAADSPTPSEEAQSKPSDKNVYLTGETVFNVACESHRKSSVGTKTSATTEERDPNYEYLV